MPARISLLVFSGLLCCLNPAARAEKTSRSEVRLERITNRVPWPRGVRSIDGKLYAIGRGVHRSAGGPNPDIDDMGGTLFVIDPNVSEPVVKGKEPGEAVRLNGDIVAEPTSPPFHVWDGRSPSTLDTRTDRPYCMLVWDEPSKNFFVCGYSGIDLPKPRKFRKNATDSIHRYDMRMGRWFAVEAHNPNAVPAGELKKTVAPSYYPHHDTKKNPPPHGLVNGPCGAAIAGHYLYVAGKDNTSLARYDLRAIRKNPLAGPPQGRYVFHRAGWDDNVFVDVEGHGSTYIEGPAALGVHRGYLYVCFRTTSQILRFKLEEDGDIVRPLEAEYIAQFPRYKPGKGGSANIYDITFDKQGRMYVSPGYDGAIYRFKPDPREVYDATKGYKKPFVDLEELVGAKKTGNICLDPAGNLYICSGKKELSGTNIRGAIYRVPAR